jgi:hypothetical protein
MICCRSCINLKSLPEGHNYWRKQVQSDHSRWTAHCSSENTKYPILANWDVITDAARELQMIVRDHSVRAFVREYSSDSSYSSLLVSVTEGSKSNIPCCALLVRQVRATFASDSWMWRAHQAWIWHIGHSNIIRANFAYDVRHVHVHSPRIMQCCAHLPREECATMDITFGPLYHLRWSDHIQPPRQQ